MCLFSNKLGDAGQTVDLIEQVLAPFLVLVADQAHQLPRGVQRKRAWPPRQRKPSLLRSPVALAVVALVAAGDQIFPR